MPVYAYKCIECGSDFERLRGISSNDNELECPTCGRGGTAKRKLSLFAAMSKTDGVTRPASTANSSPSNNGGCCGGGCGCHH
jgi:putative FmdB family regulatory protein